MGSRSLRARRITQITVHKKLTPWCHGATLGEAVVESAGGGRGDVNDSLDGVQHSAQSVDLLGRAADIYRDSEST